MGFKLVRTDSAEPCKIQLPVGRHVFGRDALLFIDDERVASHHGELIVTEDTVTVKALPPNKCYGKRRLLDDLYPLENDEEMSIDNGDSFGVLQDMYWYELYYIGNDDKEDGEEEMETEAEPVKLEDNKNDVDSPPLLPPEDNDTAGGSRECLAPSPSKRSHSTDNDCWLPIKKSKKSDD